MTESTGPDTSTKCCLICTVPIHFSRLGVHACRPCAAFYKRVKVTGKVLICRQGDNKCVFRKHEKFMCRKCRFDKCVELGMDYIPEGRVMKKETTSDASQPSSSSASPSTCRAQTLLETIRIAYDACCERRRAQELELVKKHNLERLPSVSEEVYVLSFEAIVESSIATAPEFMQFFKEVFPSLSVLPEDLQEQLYRLSVTPFMMIESIFRTKRIWGRITNYMMSSVLMCSDSDNLEVWTGPEKDSPLRNELIMIRLYVEEQKHSIIPVVEKANLNEIEFLALLPLLLSEVELPIEIAEQHQYLLESIRRFVLEDLKRFYTEEMGICKYSTRLGNLLAICNGCRESYELFIKFFRMQVTVFDLYKTERRLQDLIL